MFYTYMYKYMRLIQIAKYMYVYINIYISGSFPIGPNWTWARNVIFRVRSLIQGGILLRGFRGWRGGGASKPLRIVPRYEGFLGQYCTEGFLRWVSIRGPLGRLPLRQPIRKVPIFPTRYISVYIYICIYLSA